MTIIVATVARGGSLDFLDAIRFFLEGVGETTTQQSFSLTARSLRQGGTFPAQGGRRQQVHVGM